jgi:hypothetical protein
LHKSIFSTCRCLQHLVDCLQHFVVCNISLLQSINISSFYSTHILISRCERLVRSDQSINISSFYSIHILIPRCKRLVSSGQVRSINQNQLVLFYSHTNFTVRAVDQLRSGQINISSFYSTHILIPRCERLVRSDQVRSINQHQFVLLT